MTYTVKNVKTFASPDGGGFNASLYHGKTKVANIHDGGYGGCVDIDWLDTSKNGQFNPDRHFAKDFYAFLETHEVPDFKWDAKKKRYVDNGKMFNPDDTYYLSTMVEEFLDAKWWKGRLKKKIFFLEDGKVYSMKVPPSEIERVRELFDEKYPNRKIMNDLPIEEVLAIAKEN